MGVFWAVVAGLGFGIFQAINRRANLGVDPFRATFVLFMVSSAGLATVITARGEVGMLVGAPMRSIGSFAAAGLIHFFVGWTFLTLGQQRLGAARTGGMVGTAPLFGTALAALVLGELIRPLGLVGVMLVVAGVALLSLRRTPLIPGEDLSPWGVAFGLGAAVCWGTSPVFIRWGLEGLPYPLVGVTVGLTATAMAYGTVLGVIRPGRTIPAANRRLLLLAGSVVAVAIASLWTALSLAPVAVVLALAQLATPVVVIFAPIIVGGTMERLTARVVAGAGSVFLGSLILITSRTSA